MDRTIILAGLKALSQCVVRMGFIAMGCWLLQFFASWLVGWLFPGLPSWVQLIAVIAMLAGGFLLVMTWGIKPYDEFEHRYSTR